MSRRFMRIVLTATALSLLTASAAVATTFNQRTTDRYLALEGGYAKALAATEPAEQAAANAFVAGISSGCPQSLSAQTAAAGAAQTHTYTALTTEAGAELAIAEAVPALAVGDRWSARFTGLRWHDQKIIRLMAEEARYRRAYEALTPPALCADVLTANADGLTTEPADTSAFLSAVAALERLVPSQDGTIGLLSDLERYVTAKEAPVWVRDVTLTKHFLSTSETIITLAASAEAKALVNIPQG